VNNDNKLIYILPNFFTALNIFFGMMSIIAASQGKFEKAFLYIVFAFIADGLDGRVARLTNTSSKFGLEFDSLADVVSFGVAPAMFLFFAVGSDYGRVGALITGLFVVFGAIRLARFNITTNTNEPGVFIGLPIPTSAAILTTWVMLTIDYQINLDFIVLAGALVLSILMVSNVRFPSFKKINLSKSNKLKVLVIIIIIASFLFLYPRETLGIVLSSYILYGIVRAVWAISKIKKENNE
jgi:CDP-diacylglycerol--serine O-phosphatidyltransferase